MTRQCTAGQARQGMARTGKAGLSTAGMAWQGRARLGAARHGDLSRSIKGSPISHLRSGPVSRSSCASLLARSDKDFTREVSLARKPRSLRQK